MIQSLRLNIPEVKQAWLADDSAGRGRLVQLHNWYKCLEGEGKKYGYLINGQKCWLIVKSQELTEEEVNITTEGKRHLAAVIGSIEYKHQYCRDKVQEWRRDITSLAEIAKSQPHAVYIALTKAYKSKFTYFMRTIEAFEEYVDRYVKPNEMLFPQPFGQEEPLVD
jgi:predicted secreted protein